MGAEIQVCSLTLDIQPTPVVGDTRMPKSWTIFEPVDKALKPSREQLQSIPATFSGAKAQTAHLISNTLDLAPLAGSGPSQCLWAFARIEAKYDCEMTVGAGAGGAMQYYLNGEPVFHIPAPDDAESPVETDHHVKNVRLQTGDERHRGQDRRGQGQRDSENSPVRWICAANRKPRRRRSRSISSPSSIRSR